ncbi:twitching motility protein PilT [Alkalihalobacillus alcalophilus ATCC 27647 = CGMCC 1.3604]|uniref:Twitching motility protein PilT n=1 Tax=Alkalihalobacillus alcalophilus ATCC 27647 = CGMCC 1.3604 TaxID=1218173 RepID=A0A094WNR9_ALKAL|nr:type IV pilus twitching motility protein PilT [Alkalihalobacillus alcalophilus]KGA97618.1 twitching motility protein PilT [Alkalihalobacillus alcalophilus ATCC 27647 = CGMCC 1.3604]MED1561406.1 type IV pilus twitching motility protein PilT [Alkalihalobacillus alcalophilus]THG91445.1 twitching motility protein PilT [Alkalihalobacillus alcalophilus ATCC 27647 = CGMCC 1.3604]
MKEKVENLLTDAFYKGASDIHLTVGIPAMFRINGELQKANDLIIRPDDTEGMAKALIPANLWEQFETKKDLDFSYGIANVSRYRVNAYYQRGCVCLAVRVVPTSIPSLEELNMPDVLKDLAQKPHGLVLVTGPTGSGKSTTLASMIDYVNRNFNRHIITLEDPIEYLHKHQKCVINQREVGSDTNNFANGLKSCLRQDPDIILVGEMRDNETIATAITAAETGHLVLGTLHTTDAASTIDRIIDVFPHTQQAQVRIQLASVLRGVVTQRLFKQKNFSGRVAATEILINNGAVRNLIRNEKIYQIRSVMQTSRAQGMHTLEMAINQLIKENHVSKETVLPYLTEGAV